MSNAIRYRFKFARSVRRTKTKMLRARCHLEALLTSL